MACGGYSREVQRNASNLRGAAKCIESARCAERGGRQEGERITRPSAMGKLEQQEVGDSSAGVTK